MADIFDEIDEDLRRDRFNALWRRYRWAAFTAAALVVAGTAGFVQWQNWQLRQRQALGARFEQAASLAASDPAKGTASLETLAQGGSAGYQLLARFTAATVKVKGSDRAGGIAAFKAIAADPAVDHVYRDLATILAASYGVDTETPGIVEAELQPLSVAPDPWRFSALELTALAKYKAGDQDAALKLYRQLADDLEAPQSLRARATEIVNGLRSKD